MIHEYKHFVCLIDDVIKAEVGGDFRPESSFHVS